MSLWSSTVVPNDPEGLLADDDSALWSNTDEPLLDDEWEISHLFRNGYNGGYWPADPAYLYEDSAGTTAASVNGVVGFARNANQTMGVELVPTSLPTPTITNTSGTVGVWTPENRTMTNSGASTTGYPRFAFSMATTIGKQYFVYGKLSGNTSRVNDVRLALSGALNNVPYDSTTGIFSGMVFAAAATIQFNTSISSIESLTIESLSIKEVFGPPAIQSTTANKPYLRRTPTSQKYWLDSNTANGALTATFASSLGSACTIATVGAEGVTILENQTVGTTYNLTPYNASELTRYRGDTLIINRALTVAEKALVTRYFQRGVPTVANGAIL